MLISRRKRVGSTQKATLAYSSRASGIDDFEEGTAS